MAISEKLYTVTEFEAFLAEPENSERRFELIDGEIVEKMPTEEHSIVAGNFYVPLRTYAKTHGGRALFEVRRRPEGDNYNDRLPDVEYTSAERLLPVVKKGSVPQMPDLAVEIKSPTDSYIKLREKALYYLKNGTRLVWLVFPERQQIEIHRSDAPVQTLGIDDTLDGGDVLPGFTMPVKDAFEL
jgi:Uma2 family endonuclease